MGVVLTLNIQLDEKCCSLYWYAFTYRIQTVSQRVTDDGDEVATETTTVESSETYTNPNSRIRPDGNSNPVRKLKTQFALLVVHL